MDPVTTSPPRIIGESLPDIGWNRTDREFDEAWIEEWAFDDADSGRTSFSVDHVQRSLDRRSTIGRSAHCYVVEGVNLITAVGDALRVEASLGSAAVTVEVRLGSDPSFNVAVLTDPES